MSNVKSAAQSKPDDALQAALAEVERLKAALAAKEIGGKVTFKVSETLKDGTPGKRCLLVYGLQTRPVVLYAGQWERLTGPGAFAPCAECAPHLGAIPELHAFIRDNRDRLAWKTTDEAKGGAKA